MLALYSILAFGCMGLFGFCARGVLEHVVEEHPTQMAVAEGVLALLAAALAALFALQLDLHLHV